MFRLFPDQAENCHGSCICLRIGVYFGNVDGIRSALILKVNDIRLFEISFVFFIQCGIVRRRQSYTQFHFDEIIFVAFGCIDFFGDTIERENEKLVCGSFVPDGEFRLPLVLAQEV